MFIEILVSYTIVEENLASTGRLSNIMPSTVMPSTRTPSTRMPSHKMPSTRMPI